MPSDAQGTKPEEQEAQEKAMQETLNKALSSASAMVSAAKEKGTESKLGALSNARGMGKAPVDWKAELAEFIGSVTDSVRNRSYARITRRPMKGLIKPGTKRQGLPHIGVVLDTSGSMMSDIPEMLSELEALSGDGYSMSIVCCDTESSPVQEFDAGDFDASDLEILGGGGSDLEPGFDAVMEEREVDGIVCLTDAYIDLPKNPPSTKVLFVLTPYCCDLPKRWSKCQDVSTVKKMTI